MHNPLINILIRVSRPRLFERCLSSVLSQTYTNIRCVFHTDNPMSYTAVLNAKATAENLIVWDNINRYKVIKFHSHIPLIKYQWNLYVNTLKKEVEDGYWFIMDDDDYLSDKDILTKLVRHLQDEPDGLVVQFLRNGKPKPNNHLIATKSIRLGLIGGGCLVLHSKHKDVADWDGERAADYRWIKSVSEKVKLKFIPLVLQVAGNNGLHGRNEINQRQFERQYYNTPKIKHRP